MLQGDEGRCSRGLRIIVDHPEIYKVRRTLEQMGVLTSSLDQKSGRHAGNQTRVIELSKTKK